MVSWVSLTAVSLALKFNSSKFLKETIYLTFKFIGLLFKHVPVKPQITSATTKALEDLGCNMTPGFLAHSGTRNSEYLWGHILRLPNTPGVFPRPWESTKGSQACAPLRGPGWFSFLLHLQSQTRCPLEVWRPERGAGDTGFYCTQSWEHATPGKGTYASGGGETLPPRRRHTGAGSFTGKVGRLETVSREGSDLWSETSV